MARPYYRVQVTVGPKTWDVTSTDDPAPGPVLPLSFGWAVPDNSLGFPAQPDPASASLAIAAPTPDDIAGIDIGSPVAVTTWLSDPSAPVATHSEAVPDLTFTGSWLQDSASYSNTRAYTYTSGSEAIAEMTVLTAGYYDVEVDADRDAIYYRTSGPVYVDGILVGRCDYDSPTDSFSRSWVTVGTIYLTAGPHTVTAKHAGSDGNQPPENSYISLFGLRVRPALHTGPVASFAGRVAEMRARPDLTHGTVYQITALDYSVDLSASLVGGTAWPAETAEARSDRILAEAGKTPPAGLAPDPGGSVAARPAAPVSARDILLETLAHGVTTDKARWIVTSDVNAESGALDVVPYSYRPVRRAVYAIDVLDPCVIDVGVEWVRSRRSAADWITIDHPGGPTVYGNPTGVPLPPLKTDQTNPATLAAYLLDNVAGYAWDGGTLRLHLSAPDAAPLWRMVAGWFDYGLGRAVVVPDIPAPQSPGGTTRYSGMMSAARFTIPTDGRPVVDFRLRADVPNDSYQVTRWSDFAAGDTWANINAATTWDDYEPGGGSGGQGVLTRTWSTIDPAVTWATYDQTLTWFDHRTIPKP